MSDAPERIWFDRNMRFDHQAPILYQADREDDDIEYVRADLARLSDDLVSEMRLCADYDRPLDPWRLIRRVLAWHERQEKGE